MQTVGDGCGGGHHDAWRPSISTAPSRTTSYHGELDRSNAGRTGQDGKSQAPASCRKEMRSKGQLGPRSWRRDEPAPACTFQITSVTWLMHKICSTNCLQGIFIFFLLMDFPLLNQWQGRASHLPSRYLKMTSISFVSAWFKSYVSSACVFIYPFDFVG